MRASLLPRLAILLLALIPASAFAHARRAVHRAPPPSPWSLCDAAVARVDGTGGVPDGLLPTLARVESGRPDAAGTTRAWPWTIDVEGQGQFFATKADAVAAVRALQDLGIHSIDVGCLQVNLMYHPTAFASLDQAFDPVANARYAARFLLALYNRDGDWSRAIAAYHSETPSLGGPYRAKVLALWQHNGFGQSQASGRPLDPPRAAYADFLPTSARYADFAGCRCADKPGKQAVCRCD